jgi:RHS repeat-associated protein
MQVQLPVSMELRPPGGLRAVGTHERVALLENPLQPLSLLRQTETIRLGGRVYTREEDPRARTSVVTLPSGRRWVTERDEAGRMALLRFASLHPIRFLHDERGRFAGTVRGEGAEERRMLIARDAEGRIESITDALGNVRRFTRDAVGRLVRIEEPDGGVLRFAHDARGNLISVTPPDRPAHAFSYTAAGLPSSYLPPAAGAELRETSIERNLDGQPIGVLRPDGRSLSFEYDGGGRLSRAVFPDRQVSVSYDSSTGALAAVEGGGLRLTYGHDGGLPTSETWSGAISGAVRWTYDNDLRIASQSVDGAGAVDFAYDADGRLSRAGTLAFERDPASGLITGAALGVLRSSWAWNGFAEPVSHAAASGGVPLLEATYRRDKLGRIFEEVETIGGSTIETSYQYDAAGRLVRVIRGGSIAAEYSYDRNGNRVGASGPGGAITADFDAQDRMTRYGDATYSYTAAGELLAKTTPGGTTRYDYDVQGNLLRAELPDGRTIQYLVDPWDRRVAKVVDGTRVQGFLYEGFLRPVVELDGAGRLRSRFIYGSRANVPEYMVRDGRTYRLIHDPRGSPRLVVDAASGEVAQRLDYDAFGNVTLDSNPGFQPFGFAGGLHDPDTGLVRFGVRDYDPETGRWTAKDPLLFGGVSANFYAYARNDPVNRVDPTGELAPLLAGLWVAVEVGLTVLDFIATLDTVLDACATAAEKWTSVGLFALGVFIPTGGFAAGKWLARTNRWPRLARWADDVFGLGSRSLGPQVDREGAEYVERYIRSSGLTEAELRATSTDIDDAYRAGRSSGRVTDRPHRGRPYNDYPFESWP